MKSWRTDVNSWRKAGRLFPPRGNLRARYGLTEACGKRIVGALMANRVGRSVDRMSGELATALELSMEEATAWVMEGRQGLVDPDDGSTMVLEFDPDRAPPTYRRPKQTPVNPTTPGSASVGSRHSTQGPHPPRVQPAPKRQRVGTKEPRTLRPSESERSRARVE